MDLKDFIDHNKPGPILKIIHFIQSLAIFTLITSATSFVGWLMFIGADCYICGELFGIFFISAMIFIWIIMLLKSIIPPEVIDQIYESLEEELEEQKKNKNENKKEE